MVAPASLSAGQSLPGIRTSCSWAAGWRSLLLRGYSDPPAADEVTTAPTADHLIVLVTAGRCTIESNEDGQWLSAHYRPGHLGMTPPHQAARLRWQGSGRHHTLHLHLPSATIEQVAETIAPRRTRPIALPGYLVADDPLIAATILTLERAFQDGAPDLYAETAAQFLAAHLLAQHTPLREVGRESSASTPLRRVEQFMQDHLAESLTLAQLATVAGMSQFQLLRATKAAWDETPLRRLTRLRMGLARQLLDLGSLSIIEIALSCGYSNPSHFATAFRRHNGLTPDQYRRR